MSATLSRRLAFLLVVSSMSFPIIDCGKRAAPPPPPPTSVCDHGNNSKIKPVICVDESALTADPKTAYVCDFEPEPNDPHKKSTTPVKIQWVGKHGGAFRIKLKVGGTSCFDEPDCKTTAGKCFATVKALNEGETERRCTVSIVAPGQADPDQDIVINPCCP